jgi:hypothetical protein
MTPDPLAIFEGGVTRVRTMADGSPRFEFEAGEDAISQMQRLAQAQAEKRYLVVMVFDEGEWKAFEASSR